MSDAPDTEDEIVAKVSDYLDGALAPADREAIAARIASDAAWQRVHAELRETRDMISGLQKQHAPARFAEDVTATIHKRSAGRFFARRTFGDRVPFGVLLAIALVLMIAIAGIMWTSQTGSLAVRHDDGAGAGSGSQTLVPRP